MDQLDRIGRFETVRLLGRGGMGEVYLARDPLIDRLVAVKLLSAAFDTTARDRFSREARAAGRLAHENIVTVFDVGEHRDRPFIAMEYVPGDTLGTLIRQRPSPRRGELLRLIHDACVGLAFAHRSGVVHLDVKPENLIRREDGRLKILDFGLARVVAMDETHTRHSAGTLRYMSPEQLNGGQVDHRSDVFGLGCVLYEALTGRPAFGSTWPDVLARLSAGWVPKPSEQVPHLHPALDRMTTRALALEPGDRYQDLAALATDLAALRHELEVEGPPDTGSFSGPVEVPKATSRTQPIVAPDVAATVPDTRSIAAAPPSSAAAIAPPVAPTRRSPLPWVAGAVAAAVVIAVAITQWPQPPAAAPSQIAAVPSAPAPKPEPPPAVTTTPTPPAERRTDPPPSTAATPAAPDASRDVTSARPDPDEARERAALSAAVWAAVARRDYATALRRLREAPATSEALLPDLTKQARAVADGARRVAEARRGDVPDTAEYRAAVADLTRARRADARGRTIDRLAAEWAAADSFAKAEAAAAAERRSAAPQLPATGAGTTPERSLPNPRDIPVPIPAVPPPESPRPPAVTTPAVGPPTTSERLAERPADPPPAASPSPSSSPRRIPTAEELVRAALANYEAAYDAHDVAALRRVFVGLSADQAQALTRTFADAVSYRVDLRVLDVNVIGGTATATCVLTHVLVPKVGSPSRTTQTSSFQLAPAGNERWVITRVTAGR